MSDEVENEEGEEEVQESPEQRARTYIENEFRIAADYKNPVEHKMLDSFRAWRGVYSPEEQSAMNTARDKNLGASQVFIKITKTKVHAVHSQVLEVLFSNQTPAIGIEATPVPEGAPDMVHLTSSTAISTPDTASNDNPYSAIGYAGDGNDLEPGTTLKDLIKVPKGALKRLIDNESTEVKEGTTVNPEDVVMFPAQASAVEMEKLIHDQLIESDFDSIIRRAMLESIMLGTGCIKGPFVELEEVARWELDEETGTKRYKPYYKKCPKFAWASIWNIYLAPRCLTVDDSPYVIERHPNVTGNELRRLQYTRGYNKEAVDRILESMTYSARTEHWENDIVDANDNATNQRTYEMLEYWGFIDRELAEDLELDISDYEDDEPFIPVCMIACAGELIKAVVNPYTPAYKPYYLCPYEENLNQPWGQSLPENMSDTQMLMNGHMRMAIDNLSLAGNVMVEVNEQYMSTEETYEIYPGKIWKKTGGAPGQSVYPITFNNTAQSHLFMFDKARVLSDEAVGVPSFSHGQTGVSGVGRTASGIGMLMGAAATGIKSVVRNVDHYWLRPVGERSFQWNMQFNTDMPEIHGDYKIVARGTSSLMVKEIRTQRLLALMQVLLSNPATAPMLNVDYTVKELARASDLDPDKVLNDPKVAAMAAKMIQQVGGINVQQQGTQAVSQPGAPGVGVGPISPENGTPAQTGPQGSQIGSGSVPVIG